MRDSEKLDFILKELQEIKRLVDPLRQVSEEEEITSLGEAIIAGDTKRAKALIKAKNARRTR